MSLALFAPKLTIVTTGMSKGFRCLMFSFLADSLTGASTDRKEQSNFMIPIGSSLVPLPLTKTPVERCFRLPRGGFSSNDPLW